MPAYGEAILATYAVGSLALTTTLQARVPGLRRLGILGIYCAVLAPTAAWGALLYGGRGLVPTSAVAGLAAVPTGILAGLLARRADREVIRRLSRRAFARRRRMAVTTEITAGLRPRMAVVSIGLGASGGGRRPSWPAGPRPWPATPPDVTARFGPGIAVLVAVLEESSSSDRWSENV